MPRLSSTKTFNGKRFKLHSADESKLKAKATAKRLRLEGRRARVIKGLHDYGVYVRS